MGKNLIDQSDFKDTVDQADYIFCEERRKLIKNYIEKVDKFKLNTIGKSSKNEQDSYKENIIKKVKSLFETELTISEHINSEPATLPPLMPKLTQSKIEGQPFVSKITKFY